MAATARVRRVWIEYWSWYGLFAAVYGLFVVAARHQAPRRHLGRGRPPLAAEARRLRVARWLGSSL
jgi:hypothetical protein